MTPSTDLEDLERFLVVADELHFGRAAARLHLSPAAVSQSIRRLERRVGGRVFDRTSRSVRLSRLGEDLIQPARDACVAVTRVYERGRELAREEAARFVLAYARDRAGRLLALAEALRPHRLELRCLPTPTQLAAVNTGRIDAGVGWEPELPGDLQAETITASPFVAIVPEDGGPPSGPIHLDDLLDRPLVGWPPSLAPGLTSTLQAACAAPLQFAATAAAVDDLVALVLAGRGTALVPQVLLEDRSLSGVRIVALRGAPAARERLVWRRDAAHPLVPRLVTLLRDPGCDPARGWSEEVTAGVSSPVSRREPATCASPRG